jgi:tetratricopeptide (TPR) repeat protein
MNFRTELPSRQAHVLQGCARDVQAEGRPAAAPEGRKSPAKRFGWRLCRRNPRPIKPGPGCRSTAALSNLISLNLNINRNMGCARVYIDIAELISSGGATWWQASVPEHVGTPQKLTFLLLVCLVLGAFLPATLADDPSAAARRSYHQAKAKFEEPGYKTNAAWEFGRTCFDLADFATNNAQRAELAHEGIAACREALAHDTNSAPAHYYLGLNLGQLARTRGLSALKLIKEMEAEWTAAAVLDRNLDYAGPERSLGMLYRDAPSFASVGNRRKAREQLTRAVELAPHYAENRLELIDTYLKWGDRANAQRELKALEEAWPAARAEFTGPSWADSWKSWESRLEKAKKRAEEPAKLETPRHE